MLLLIFSARDNIKMIDAKREELVRSLAYLFTREELRQFCRTLAKAGQQHAQLWALCNDAELGDYRDLTC